MTRHRPAYSTRLLVGLAVLAIAYAALPLALRTPTGNRLVDGGIGVALGLYICSRPAAHAVDLIFWERALLEQLASQWTGLAWLALNLLVMALGWMVLVSGLMVVVG